MEAVDKNKTKGIIVMPTTVLNPSKASGIKAVPEIGKESPQWNVGIMDRKATERESAGRIVPIGINMNRAKPIMEIGSYPTTSRARKDPEMDWALTL